MNRRKKFDLNLTKFPTIDKCILCLQNPSNSLEHIIPESIGGRFQLYLLCKGCNSELGSEIIGKVKTEPSIRLAIQNLKNEIPELFKKMEHNQIYIATDINDRQIELKYKDSTLETRARKLW